ncbi:MAG: tetratricopeptide repeat protein, partial [Anaerolineae bacterium]|nr:tetratricopeptide repeat protein [Anaerolineae bacterium]
MIETLHLNLLGKPQIVLGERPLTGLATAKAEALLYYLAVTGQPHSRETLVELLWGDMPEAKAKRNLTTTLGTLRKAVEPYIIIESQSVAFNLDAPHQVDVTLFQAAVEGSTDLEPTDLERDLAPLRQAVNFYKGDFLAGFYVKNALSFEAWSAEQRDYFQTLMVQVLNSLIEHYTKQPKSDPLVAIEYANRLLVLEPWHETAHRELMLLLAQTGQRGAALAQYETCSRILVEELGVEPAAETKALYERIKKTEKPITHNLPSQTNTFVGRTREMDQLTANLDNPDCRLLTLVGPGGIGKTRLSLEGARQYLKPDKVFDGVTFFDGVYVVNLAPIATPETTRSNALSNLLAAAIANAIDFSFYGPADQMDQLGQHLREKEILFILDNFEHLIEGATLLPDLLQRAKGIKLLVTSRERLNLMEEWVIELDGLDFPIDFPKGKTTLPAFAHPQSQHRASELSRPSLSNLEHYSAINLFGEQVRQIRGNFQLTEAEAPHVIRISQLVDGCPLALILAASWLRVLSIEEVVQEIERSLDFLSASQRNIPERHRSMRAVFDYSWQMLTELERSVFMKLSIFRGGFRRDAAQEVVRATLLTLTALVDKSLLRASPSGRYDVHELVRQFAAEKLSQMPDEQMTTQEKHCRYYAKFLQARDARPSDADRFDWLNQINPDIDNIRAGWGWAVTHCQESLIEPSIEGLFDFFWLRSRFYEGADAFAEAVKGLAQIDDKQLLARLQLRQGAFCGALGLYDKAERLLNDALRVLQPPELAEEIALALIYLGDSARDQGRYKEAQQHYEASIALSKHFEGSYHRATALYGLGSIGEGSGEFAMAQHYFLESLELFRAANMPDGVANGLDKLGLIAWVLGEYDDAEAYYNESLELFNQSKNRLGISLALGGLGLVAWGRGGPELAQA